MFLSVQCSSRNHIEGTRVINKQNRKAKSSMRYRFWKCEQRPPMLCPLQEIVRPAKFPPSDIEATLFDRYCHWHSSRCRLKRTTGPSTWALGFSRQSKTLDCLSNCDTREFSLHLKAGLAALAYATVIEFVLLYCGPLCWERYNVCWSSAGLSQWVSDVKTIGPPSL